MKSGFGFNSHQLVKMLYLLFFNNQIMNLVANLIFVLTVKNKQKTTARIVMCIFVASYAMMLYMDCSSLGIRESGNLIEFIIYIKIRLLL